MNEYRVSVRMTVSFTAQNVVVTCVPDKKNFKMKNIQNVKILRGKGAKVEKQAHIRSFTLTLKEVFFMFVNVEWGNCTWLDS